MKQKTPLLFSSVAAGFPSPASDFVDKRIDLNSLLITRPSSTFFVRVKGSSMVDTGIDSGDLLVVDKSLQPSNGDIVIAYLDGQFTVKKISIRKNYAYLNAANDRFDSIRVGKKDDFKVWGVVIHVIKSFKKISDYE